MLACRIPWTEATFHIKDCVTSNISEFIINILMVFTSGMLLQGLDLQKTLAGKHFPSR